jgi:hypothetical protein
MSFVRCLGLGSKIRRVTPNRKSAVHRRLLRLELLEARLPLAAEVFGTGVIADLGDVIPAGGGDAVLQVRLEASQTIGGPAIVGPIDRNVDATFFINAYVRDLRATPQGVVGGAIDLSWVPDLVSVGNSISYGSNFGLFRQGVVSNAANEVNEVGALTSSTGAGAGSDALFFAIEVTAESDGTVTVTGSAGEGTSTINPANFALVGQGTPVDWDDVLFVNAMVQIMSAQPQLPTMSIGDVTQAEGNSGTTQFMFPVTLSQSSTSTITVTVNTQNGTATVADGDYSAITNQTVTFAPGDTQEMVTVSVTGDQKFEPNEGFSVVLSNVSAGATINDAEGVGTINNDDSQPTISVNNVSLFEGDAGATTPFVFELQLSNPSSQAVTVQVSTADGTATLADMDYQQFSQQITIQPGATSSMATVNVVGDDRVEPDETFSVNLTSPTGAALGTAVGTGTIRNDDEEEASTSDISGAVYTDTDGSGSFDTNESGIPNVTITLRNTTNSVMRTALTDAQGRYSFTDLPLGTYSVIETHPVAFFDGSDQVGTAGGMLQDDQISNIVITATMGSTGNNFGESWLRPQYISRRMFLASTPPLSQFLGEIVRATQPASSNLSAAATASFEEMQTAAALADIDVPPPIAIRSARSAASSALDVAEHETVSEVLSVQGAEATTVALALQETSSERVAMAVDASAFEGFLSPSQWTASSASQNRTDSHTAASNLPRSTTLASSTNLLVQNPRMAIRRPLASNLASDTAVELEAVDLALEEEEENWLSLAGNLL